jgi:hypothetical protein
VAFGRGQAIAFREYLDDMDDLNGYISRIPDLDWFLESDLAFQPDSKWTHDIEVPVHKISTDPDYLSRFKPSKYGNPVEVTTGQHLQDFSYLQDVAYNRVYGYPRGIGASFYIDSRSVIADNTFAAILYDGDIPVRAGYCIVIDRYPFGVGGAVNPDYAGQHLGETLWPLIGEWVQSCYGLDTVYHVTMPCAVPIMKRYNIPRLTTWRRYRRVRA